jgi:hypothetical protein
MDLQAFTLAQRLLDRVASLLRNRPRKGACANR